MKKSYRIPVYILCFCILVLPSLGCGKTPSRNMENTPGPSFADSPASAERPSPSESTDSGKSPVNTENPETMITEDLSGYFTGYEGCFVLFDQNQNKYTVYNEEKSGKRMPPCSSFKIVNALIGLETGVLADENTAFPWDRTQYAIESWNQDQTLQSAVTHSCVWYFQRVAAEVGEERMQEYLDGIEYGNRDISGGITEFWLMSSLTISPMEQVGILRRMYGCQLPVSRENIDTVKKVITLSDENGIRLSGKTGSGVGANGNRYSNGWFVGYVEKDGNAYFFATNIEPDGASDESAGGIQAKEITLSILRDKGLY